MHAWISLAPRAAPTGADMLRLLVVICASAALVGAYVSAHAQRYPERPLRFITPFPPGSAPDNVARIMAPQMSIIAGQPVVVDSRPGAAGTLAMDIGAKAPADGYTVSM